MPRCLVRPRLRRVGPVQAAASRERRVLEALGLRISRRRRRVARASRSSRRAATFDRRWMPGDRIGRRCRRRIPRQRRSLPRFPRPATTRPAIDGTGHRRSRTIDKAGPSTQPGIDAVGHRPSRTIDKAGPSIKDIRIDQGQTHAEKRSNHVRSSLIDGRGGRDRRKRGGIDGKGREGASESATCEMGERERVFSWGNGAHVRAFTLVAGVRDLDYGGRENSVSCGNGRRDTAPSGRSRYPAHQTYDLRM
jgi:hypothetical protein